MIFDIPQASVSFMLWPQIRLYKILVLDWVSRSDEIIGFFTSKMFIYVARISYIRKVYIYFVEIILASISLCLAILRSLCCSVFSS